MSKNIITRIEEFAASSGQSESTLARKVFNDGKTLTRLRNGGQLTPRTQEKAMAALDTLERDAAGPLGQKLTHLDRLEAESIHIMREVVAQCENPVMLYSVGKDSSVMLELAIKAFYPSPPPFALLHVDTRWKFKEMYEFRDRRAKEAGMELIAHINPDAIEQNVGPFSHGSAVHTDITKTQGLKQAKNQRPELWDIYNARVQKGESMRVFPISNWTELDIWQYIYRENIQIPGLYLSAERPVVERDGGLIMVDDERMPLKPGEKPMMKSVRFRTLGCYPLTGAVESEATTLQDVIQEILLATGSERQGRVIDSDAGQSMEKKKEEGYF